MATSSSSASSDSLSSPPSSPGDSSYAYAPGTTLILKRHVPPPPTGQYYEGPTAPRWEVPGKVPKLEWCLTHSPRPGRMDAHDTRKITFKEPIRTGFECGAQVLLTDDGVVAKIYDPLYYCIYNRGWPGESVNVTAEADQDYSNEAAAYFALQDSSLQGTIMPTYHGSWTTEVFINVEGQEQSREVRMIILEHVAGISLRDVDPFVLSAKSREKIMRKIIEADTDLRIAGLEHHDLEPRNIIISSPQGYNIASAGEVCGSSFEGSGTRICIIDFAISRVYDLAGQKRPSAGYRNPLYFWVGADIYHEYGWLPSLNEATEWMWKVWGNGGNHGKYIGVARNISDLLGRPIRPKE